MKPKRSSAASQDSETSSTKKKKKGFRKIGAIFGGKIRRRRKKKTEGGDNDAASDDGSYDSFSLPSADSKQQTSKLEQQEWIKNGGGGFSEMAAIGTGLSKIQEEEHEDASSGDFKGDNSSFRRKSGSRRGRRSLQQSKQSSDRSTGSESSSGWRSKKKKMESPDPLSLVVLLVEPVSLRFELLSLDFDLITKEQQRQLRKRLSKRVSSKTNLVPEELKLTVRDVLDQIQPSALTDDKLKKRVAETGSCLGLIDRRGTVHYGGASLETACAARPRRATADETDTSSTSASTSASLLSVPTYSGQPHRDVLLGFFGSDDSHEETEKELDDHTTNQAVAKALELARPIFADPNVIGMMENSGYDLVGWKPSKNEQFSSKSAVLGKPLPPPVRTKPSRTLGILKTLLGLMAVLVATILGFVIVGGGLHLLPSLGGELAPATTFSETLENTANWLAITVGRVTLYAVDAVLGSDVIAN